MQLFQRKPFSFHPAMLTTLLSGINCINKDEFFGNKPGTVRYISPQIEKHLIVANFEPVSPWQAEHLDKSDFSHFKDWSTIPLAEE